MGKQQTLQPAVAQLKENLTKLDAAKAIDETLETTTVFTADSGFNSEDNPS